MSRFRLAWIQIRSQIGQLAVAIVVIALGVALSAGMLLANAALRESFEESIDALAGKADLVVSPLSGGTLDQGLLDTVRETEGVQAAAGLLLGDGFTETKDPIRVRIAGVDMLDDATVRIYSTTPKDAAGIEDPLLFLSQEDSVVAPRALLRELHADAGDTLAIRTPQGIRDLTVRGVLEGRGVSSAFAGRLLIMDLFSAQEAFGWQNRLTQIDVKVSELAAPEEVSQRLQRLMPKHIGVELVSARRAELTRTVAGFQAMLNLIGVLGLLLGVIITTNRMATIYQERMWEMGVLRGIGWSPRGLVLELLAEATLLSTFGVMLGLFLGVLFGQLIVGPIGDTMALSFKQLGQANSVTVKARVAPLSLAAAAGIVAALLAAWLPARRSARATIAGLKARRRRRDPTPAGPFSRWARIVGPIAAIVLLMSAWWHGSAIAGAGAMIALAISGAVLLQPALAVVGLMLGRALGAAAAVGVRDQSRAPSRAIGAAAILMVGVGLVVWIGSTGQSFERFVVNSLMTIRRGDLVVDSALNDEFGAVGEHEPRLDEKIISELEGIPGVIIVGSDVSARSLNPETGILAVDAIRFQRKEFGDWILRPGSAPGAIESVAKGDAILADTNLVASRGLQIGDAVTILAPNGRLEKPLAGVVDPSFQSPTGDIILSRDLYRDYWKDRTVTRVFLVLEPEADREAVADRIQRGLGASYKLRVSSTSDLARWFADSVNRAFAFLDVMAVLTILVVIVGAADALFANVLERTREIGTIRALGYRPASMARMVVAQALAIGIVGAGFAVVLGVGMSWAFVWGVLQAILGWQLESHFAAAAALSSASLGIAACLLGGLLPAIRASRISIASALRYE